MSGLWALTCYFNPIGYQRRHENYLRFRERLEVPLLTVELGRDGHFDLDDASADIVVQLPRADVMWQKERLLNIGIEALPRGCDKVAWLDCDVLFVRDGWAERASRLLDHAPLAQLFHDAHYLDRSDVAVRSRPSVVSGVAAGLPAEQCLTHPNPSQRPGTYSCGLAWAAQRALLDEHGLYDANIIGGGDRAVVCAAYGCFGHETEWHYLNKRQERAYMAWAVPFHESVRGAVVHLEEDVQHLWHGDQGDRGFGQRHARLAEFDFDPTTDIALDDLGCWRWSSDKPELHRYLRDYFAARAEDG